MDIKVLVNQGPRLEQWNPRMKGQFPMKTEVLEKEVFPAFGVDMPKFARGEYTLEQYLDEIIYPHPRLTPVRVDKLRFGFTVNGCITEIAHLLINGAAIQTMAVELEDVGAVLKALEQLGLTEFENVNYLRAIKRIIGLALCEEIRRTASWRSAGVRDTREEGKREMGKEIERKFLVKGDAWKSLAKATRYRQGYLNSVKERTVRVRTVR